MNSERTAALKYLWYQTKTNHQGAPLLLRATPDRPTKKKKKRSTATVSLPSTITAAANGKPGAATNRLQRHRSDLIGPFPKPADGFVQSDSILNIFFFQPVLVGKSLKTRRGKVCFESQQPGSTFSSQSAERGRSLSCCQHRREPAVCSRLSVFTAPRPADCQVAL